MSDSDVEPLAGFATTTPDVAECFEAAISSLSPNHGDGGRFVLGNRAAWKDGLRSRQPLPAADAALVEERITAIQSDMGGAEELSAVMVGQVKRHARLELAEDALWDDLAQHGLSTGTGRTRAKASLWLAVVDRLAKSAVTLGLERRSRDIKSLSASAWMQQQQQERK